MACQIIISNTSLSHLFEVSGTNPVVEIVRADEYKIAVSMCKDGNFSLFPEMTVSEIPSQVSDALLLHEISVLEHYISNLDVHDSLFTLSSELKISGRPLKPPVPPVLITIAKLGLQYIYEVTSQLHAIDPNAILDPKTQFTLLHYASHYGRTSMVKSLLNDGFNPNQLAAYGLTPYHLSIISFNHRVLTVFEQWSAKTGTPLSKPLLGCGTDALLQASRNRVKNFDLLSSEDYTEIQCENVISQKRLMLISKKCRSINNTNLTDVVGSNDSHVELNRSLVAILQNEMEHFLAKLHGECQALKCSVKGKLLLIGIRTSLNLHCVVFVGIDKKNFIKNKFVETANITLLMKQSFTDAISSLIFENFLLRNDKVTLIYPYLRTDERGVILYFLIRHENQLYKVKMLLTVTGEDSSAYDTPSMDMYDLGNMSSLSLGRTLSPYQEKVYYTILMLFLMLNDQIYRKNYKGTKLSTENNPLSPPLRKFNELLLEAIVLESLPTDSLDKRVEWHNQTRSDSMTDLLNESSTTEDITLGLSFDIYDSILTVARKAFDLCSRRTQVSDTIDVSFHPRELDLIKQSIFTVQTFLQNIR